MRSYWKALFLTFVLWLPAHLVVADIVPLQQAMDLKNRFRIDHMMDEVTLLIQREYGSAPVVVVLPDGSKWYPSRHPEEVKWVDGVSGDIITIKNPTPGPWQLLGRVVEGSKIQFISKLEIEVDPLPQPLFQGERIKVAAKLMGDDQRVRMPGLDFLVEWTARFISEHKPGEENFAAGTFTVGSYSDNGEGLDERPDDGAFTGNLNLNQAWGNYIYQVRVRNNIFERETEQKFTLSQRPIDISIVKPEDPLEDRWRLKVKADESLLSLSDTHVSLELVGPAGLQLPVSQNGFEAAESEMLLPVVSEFGSYRLKGHVASSTLGGREILLSVPEMFFNLIEPPEPPPTPEELAAMEARRAALAEAKAKETALFWIILINAVLLVLGTVGLIVWRKRQSLAANLAEVEKQLAEEEKAAEAAEEINMDDIDLNVPDETVDEDEENKS